MSGLDLLGGVMTNRFWQGQQEAGAERGWQAHAGMLQRKLDRANQQNVFLTALQEANNYILQLALDALQRGETGSPLLSKEARDSLRTRYLSQNLKAKGYALNEGDWSIRPL
ncbi:TPA: hypothetical protein ACRNLW_006341 [Pseudomonas aeruginosa]|uniref:hypothetical protein n=1 Tax=Pseudomonas aeruginosa TaxID=287 RepID=UPI0005B371C4|nr:MULTISPECIES: hypothetical protein [Pseudomonadaceae]KJS29254.1 MAG: hypothetical protein VR76_06770 [Pseudomonas sp. BRH_c35]EKY4115067.1 hypothetical protein [Pseudomonas aeruginosa]ELJ2279322.1 hypothetical protein [Pseudomonas aeruginosa]KJS71601.1 MAG: hypothetical protein JL55_29630 [[Pseudomonas] sp. BICA1-14]MBH8731469.1 hypothetical protein [Pseudomonas aeruginosa]